MKILIISKEAWRDEQNGGNVLSNIFHCVDAEFAQIYCNECLPNNALCRSYFRITDKEMLNSITGGTKAGSVIQTSLDNAYVPPTKESYSSLKGIFGPYLALMREAVWKMGQYDIKVLLDFAESFNPDILMGKYLDLYKRMMTSKF